MSSARDPFLLDFFAHAKIMDPLPEERDRALNVLASVAQALHIEGLPWNRWRFFERNAALAAAYHEVIFGESHANNPSICRVISHHAREQLVVEANGG